MVDDEHGSLFGGQPAKATLHLIAHRGSVLGVAVLSRVRRRHVDLDKLALLHPSCLPVAGTDEQPVEPGVETVGVADGTDMQPGRGERFLDGIGRPVVAAQDQPGSSMQPIERTCGERRKGVVVAVPCAQDEVSLHPPPGSRRLMGRLLILSRAATESFHLRGREDRRIRRGSPGSGRPR